MFSLLLIACGTQSTGNLLNSDRIRDKFGNYGVDVILADGEQRVSSLFSTAGSTRTTRTLAIVNFSNRLPTAVADEHQQIVAGGSIGEVFRSSGWAIQKQTIFVDEVFVAETDEGIRQLMHISLPANLATHSYRFVVSQEDLRVNYATITEIHHPDYLDIAALHALFGEMLFDDSGQKKLIDIVQLPTDL